MKRLLSMALCTVLCFSMTACSLKDYANAKTKKENKKVVAEAQGMLGDDIRSGEFVLEGEVYAFPMDLQVWLDRGWHVSNNYDNKDDFELEPNMESTEFELFNEDGDYVSVCVYNASDENATVDKCMVSYLDISLTDHNVILPGGIWHASTPEEVKEAYGEPDESEDGGEQTYEPIYAFSGVDEWACEVNLQMIDNDYTYEPLSSVEYTVTGEAGWNDVLTNARGEEGCALYIDTALKTSFYGDFEEYVQYFDKEENARALYESEVEYYASGVMYYSDIDESLMSDEIIERFREISAQVLAKTKWEIVDLTLSEDQKTGSVEMNLYSTDFLTLIDEEIEAAIEEYQTKYAGVDFNSVSEAEYLASEQDYAEMVLSRIEGKVAETQNVEPVNRTYDIDYEHGIINSEDWSEMDDIIMGLSE